MFVFCIAKYMDVCLLFALSRWKPKIIIFYHGFHYEKDNKEANELYVKTNRVHNLWPMGHRSHGSGVISGDPVPTLGQKFGGMDGVQSVETILTSQFNIWFTDRHPQIARCPLCLDTTVIKASVITSLRAHWRASWEYGEHSASTSTAWRASCHRQTTVQLLATSGQVPSPPKTDLWCCGKWHFVTGRLNLAFAGRHFEREKTVWWLSSIQWMRQ